MKIVKVKVDKHGQVTIETKGFQGEECFLATEKLESKLGDTYETHLTGEYYEEEVMLNQEEESNEEILYL